MEYPKDGDIEIDGFCFYGEIKPTVSYSYRELTTTKIMNGTEVNTQGDFTPREFTVTSYIYTGTDNKRIYDKKFQEMMNKPCRVLCEDMGDMFYAKVIILKTPVTGNPGAYDLEISIKEIPDINNYYIDDTINANRTKITNNQVKVTKNTRATSSTNAVKTKSNLRKIKPKK